MTTTTPTPTKAPLGSADTPLNSFRSELSYSGKHGRLSLTIGRADGKSVVTDQFFKVPLQVAQPSYLDETGDPFIQILNPTGGLVGGDLLEMEVRLNPESSCILTTQSASKIYQTVGPPSVQTNRFEVGENARLEYLPHAIIPFAQSDFRQRTDVHLSEGAVFLMSELITPGRSSRGEWFQYRRFDSRLGVYRNDRPLLVDAFSLSPLDRPPQVRGVLGPYTHFGTFYAFLPDLPEEFLRNLNRRLNNLEGQYAGAARLETTGFMARVLGFQTYQVQETLTWIWSEIRSHILNLPVPFFRQY